LFKILIFIFIVFSSLNAGEISVFGAGDLSSSKPYGLDNKEKEILKTKKEINKVDSDVKSVKSDVSYINERIEGLESIYEGDSKKLHETVLKVNEAIENININTKEILKLKKLIQELKLADKNIKNVLNQLLAMQEQNAKENLANLTNLKLAIDKLSNNLTTVNNNYISKTELKRNMSQFVTKEEFDDFKRAIAKDLKNIMKVVKKAKAQKSKMSAKIPPKKSKAELLKIARKYFKQDLFAKAKPIFTQLAKKNYRPAECNFYLGEINYYRKQYKTAIKHFKKSALLYDKSKYMPKLLLHSAISFEKLGDIENASVFYNTLLDNFPNSKEAKEVKKNL
jgi:TolA-binding protein